MIHVRAQFGLTRAIVWMDVSAVEGPYEAFDRKLGVGRVRLLCRGVLASRQPKDSVDGVSAS